MTPYTEDDSPFAGADEIMGLFTAPPDVLEACRIWVLKNIDELLQKHEEGHVCRDGYINQMRIAKAHLSDPQPWGNRLGYEIDKAILAVLGAAAEMGLNDRHKAVKQQMSEFARDSLLVLGVLLVAMAVTLLLPPSKIVLLGHAVKGGLVGGWMGWRWRKIPNGYEAYNGVGKEVREKYLEPYLTALRQDFN